MKMKWRRELRMTGFLKEFDGEEDIEMADVVSDGVSELEFAEEL